MSEEQTFPRTEHLQLGYSALEDRVWLRLVLTQAQGVVLAWLPRRLVVGLAARLGEMLRHNHPATEGEPAADVVLALEHQAARSALAEPRQAADESEAATPELDADADAAAMWLVSEARVEQRDAYGVIGLMGHRMPTAPGAIGQPDPVAGLTLTREQTHEVLRLLVEQIDRSDWTLPRRLEWLRSGLTTDQP